MPELRRLQPREPAAGVAFGCPYAVCLVFKGGFLVSLGELDEGRRLIEQGRALAGEHSDVETVGWSHMWSTSLAYAAGEPEAGLGHAQQALEIAERSGDAFSRAWSWFWLGLAERVARALAARDRRARALGLDRRRTPNRDGRAPVVPRRARGVLPRPR